MSNIIGSNETRGAMPLLFEDAEDELRTALFLRLTRDRKDQISAAIETILDSESFLDIATVASVIWLNAVALRILDIHAERVEDPLTGATKVDLKPEVVDDLIRLTQTCDKATLVNVIVKTMLTMFTTENARVVFLSFFDRNRDMFRASEITFSVPMISDNDKRTADELVGEIAEEVRRKREKSVDEDIQVILKNSETH